MNYQQHYVNQMVHFLDSEHPEVRQAAAYGLGVMGQHGGPTFAPICASGIPKLCAIVQKPDSREAENINPTENAISAVTKILKWNASSLNLDEVLPVW